MATANVMGRENSLRASYRCFSISRSRSSARFLSPPAAWTSSLRGDLQGAAQTYRQGHGAAGQLQEMSSRRMYFPSFTFRS